MTAPPRVTYKGQTYVLAQKQRRPRSADSMTTSIKLAGREFERLAEAAHRSGLTRHAIMKLAILFYLDGLEQQRAARRTEAPQAATPATGAPRTYALPGPPPSDGKARPLSPAPPPSGPSPGQGLTLAMARMIADGVPPLCAVRGGRGFSTLRLAARLNDLGLDIDETLITQLEEGEAEMTPELAAALAKALGVEAEMLG